MSIEDVDELRHKAHEERARAQGLIEDLGPEDLDKAQRALRRKILSQLDPPHSVLLDIHGPGARAGALYDSTRRALSLLDQLETGQLSAQHKAMISSVRVALYAAEDAAGAVVRIT